MERHYLPSCAAATSLGGSGSPGGAGADRGQARLRRRVGVRNT
jgi:hypothetical protein